MQRQATRLKWNSFFSLLSAFIRLFTNFAVFAGIARIYGADVFGQFTTAHSLSTVFLLLADFGFDTLLSTEISRHRADAPAIARSYFSLKILLAGGTAAIMAAVPLVHAFSGPTTQYILIFSLYVLFSSLNNCMFAMFRGLEELHHETRISLWSNLLLVAFAVAVAALRMPLAVLAFGFVVSRLAGILQATAVARRAGLGNLLAWRAFDWHAMRHRTLVFGFHYLFGSLFFTIDSILLALWKGDHDVGVYQSVFKIVVLVLAVPDVIISAVLPVLSRFHAENEERWLFLGQLVHKTLIFVALPVATVLFVYAEDIIHLIYGATSFGEAAPLLRIFAATVLVRFAVETSALMLTTSQQQSKRLAIVIVATFVNIALNAFMIPALGTIGAAAVSLATNLAVGLGYIYFARGRFLGLAWQPGNLVAIAGTLAIGALLYYVRAIPAWCGAPAAGAASVGISLLVGYTAAERSMIFSLSTDVTHG